MFDVHSYTTPAAMEEAAPKMRKVNDGFRKMVFAATGAARLPMLSREQEHELISLAQDTHSTEAVEILMRHHEGFLINIAQKIARMTHMEHRADDIYAEACEGMIRAISKYNLEDSTARLSTFARFHVTGACLKYVHNMKHPYRVATNLPDKIAYNNVTRIRAGFEELYRRPMQENDADFALAAEMFGTTVPSLKRAFQLRSEPAAFCPQDIEIHDHRALTGERELISKDAQRLLQKYIEMVTARMILRDKDIILTVMSAPEQQAEMIYMMHRKHGITVERIRQIYRQAVADIRTALAKDGFSHLSDVA